MSDIKYTQEDIDRIFDERVLKYERIAMLKKRCYS